MKLRNVLIVLLVAVMAAMTVSASAMTVNDAMQWVYSKQGYTVGNGQCVGLTQAYIQYVSGASVGGNAWDYPYMNVPGFSCLPGATPQRGDIVIWTSSNGGHVAIYDNDYSVFEQNYSNKQYVVNNTFYWNSNSYRSHNYWGVLRPNFSGSSSAGSSSAGSSYACGCSTQYAGYYVVRGTKSGSLAINSTHSADNQIGSIPEGTLIYIDAATGYWGRGNSKGNWGHVTYNGVTGYCAMNLLEKQ